MGVACPPLNSRRVCLVTPLLSEVQTGGLMQVDSGRVIILQ